MARRIAGDRKPVDLSRLTFPAVDGDPNQHRRGQALLYASERTQSQWKLGYPAGSPPPTVFIWHGAFVPR